MRQTVASRPFVSLSDADAQSDSVLSCIVPRLSRLIHVPALLPPSQKLPQPRFRDPAWPTKRRASNISLPPLLYARTDFATDPVPIERKTVLSGNTGPPPSGRESDENRSPQPPVPKMFVSITPAKCQSVGLAQLRLPGIRPYGSRGKEGPAITETPRSSAGSNQERFQKRVSKPRMSRKAGPPARVRFVPSEETRSGRIDSVVSSTNNHKVLNSRLEYGFIMSAFDRPTLDTIWILGKRTAKVLISGAGPDKSRHGKRGRFLCLSSAPRIPCSRPDRRAFCLSTFASKPGVPKEAPPPVLGRVLTAIIHNRFRLEAVPGIVR